MWSPDAGQRGKRGPRGHGKRGQRAHGQPGKHGHGEHDGQRGMSIGTTAPWMAEAAALLGRVATTQADGIETASQWAADAIAADGLVHLFGTGHSRIPVEEMFPRYGSYPGFHPMVELSMTFHTQVVGSNGQSQAMYIERMPGLAEVILENFTFGPRDVMVVFSAGGTTAVPVEMARGARARGLRVIAVTSVEQSMTATIDPVVGSRLLDEADLVLDLCTPHADALVQIPGLDTPVGPGSTLAAIAIVNSIKVRTAQLLTERGAMTPVLTRASVVGAGRSRELFSAAYREHSRRIARAIDRGPDTVASDSRQEVAPTA